MKPSNIISLVATVVLTGLAAASSMAQSFSGYSEAVFGVPSPTVTNTRWNDNADHDAAIEIGTPSDNEPLRSWEYRPGQNRTGNTYEMNSVDFTGVTAGEVFAVSDLVYYNAITNSTGVNNYTLPVNLELNLAGIGVRTFSFNFALTYTTNSSDPEASADLLNWTNPLAPQTFTSGGEQFALQLQYFSSDGGVTETNTWRLYENATTTSTLYASIVKVAPQLTTNPGHNGTLNFGNVRVGTSGSQQLSVSNTGLPGTTLNAVIGGAPIGSEFSPTSSQSVSLAVGASTNRTYTYAPTARNNGGPADTVAVAVTSNGGNNTINLSGVGVGPVYSSTPLPGSTINLGRAMNGGTVSSSVALPISNATTDGNLGNLTNMTLRSTQLTGTDAAAFSITGLTANQVLAAGASVTPSVNYSGAVTRGNKTATLRIRTDVNAPFGATGDIYQYTLNATGVDKRVINATPVDFGRVFGSSVVTGNSTTISGAVTPDNFYTNPVLLAQGNTVGPVTVGADTADRAFNTNTGAPISVRGVSGNFTGNGTQSGSVGLTVVPEGLAGEGTYTLNVPWTANVWDRGNASFSNTVDLNNLVLDFGTVAQNFNGGSTSLNFSLNNLVSTPNFTASIDLTNVASVGSAQLFTNLPANFTGLAAGGSNPYTATMDTTTIGAFNKTITLTLRDDATINGPVVPQTLQLTLTGTVERREPPKEIRIVNGNFEQVWLSPTDDTLRILNVGQMTAGMQTTWPNDQHLVFLYIPGWESGNELDSQSGIMVPVNSPEGRNVGYSYGETFSQVLDGALNAGVVYELTFLVLSTGEPTVQLIAGGNVLEMLGGEPLLGENVGGYTLYRQLYRLEPDSPLLGLPLTLAVTGESGEITYFDDFRLVEFVPEPSAAGTILAGLMMCCQRRRLRRRLAA